MNVVYTVKSCSSPTDLKDGIKEDCVITRSHPEGSWEAITVIIPEGDADNCKVTLHQHALIIQNVHKRVQGLN